MKTNKLLACLALAPCALAIKAHAFDVVEAGQPVVTGEPSRVGPPWNHRSTIRIPGTKTDVAFGGYIKLDMLYDFDYDLGDATDPYALTDPSNRTDGRTDFTAYESRLNFRTSTQTQYGALRTYFEGHFLPDGKFNLRHAYGELNGFLAGQTWSNFQSFVGVPTQTLALGDPKGYAFERQAQVRYTRSLGDGAFSVALEDPDTVIARPDDGVAKGESELPDLTLRYEYKRLFSLSGVARKLSTDAINGTVDDETTGYGIQGQFSLPLTPATSFKGGVIYGEGIGNYMGNPSNAARKYAPDVYVNGNGELEAVEMKAYGVSLNHFWSDDWLTSTGFSHMEQDLPEDSGYADLTDTIEYSFINLIWTVNDRLQLGAEYQHVDLEQVNGENPDADRLQASAIFQF